MHLKMNQMKISLLKLLFYFLLQLEISDSINESFCPNSTDLSPCQCKNNDIDCSYNEPFDFASVFAKISEDPRVLNTTYNKLYLADKTITELPKGAIGQLKFEMIFVRYYCFGLKRIHQQAFESSSRTTRILSIQSPLIDIDAIVPYSLLGLVNSFQCLEELCIDEMIPVIQDRAFSENLTSLRSLELKTIELNGSPFYNLPNLSTLNLNNCYISYISSNAFKFKERKVDSLYINLSVNKLNDSSFEIGAIMNITGSVHLDLSRNKITYLDEQVFGPFLNSHKDNKIGLLDNPINCSDCRLYWVFKNKKLKNNNRIFSSYCNGIVEDGTIWEHEEDFRYQCGDNETITNLSFTSRCPNPALLSPCSCENHNDNKFLINCVSRNIDFNITRVFERISEKEHVKKTIYSRLWLTDNETIELNEKATGLVRFEKIYVSNHCIKLKRIHYNAFQASSKTARSLVIGNLDLETNNSDNYSLIRLVNSFENLLTLKVFVNSSQFTALSDRVFSKNLSNLSNLYLSVNRIDDSPFYHLENLTNLVLTKGTINWIPSDAFKFSKRNNQKMLAIRLSSNQLNSSSFEVGVFENIIEPVKLDLSWNRIDYLDEQIFSPFLHAHKDNMIILTRNPINCSDCRSFWMLNSERFKTQIINANCNGTMHLGTIWEKEDELKKQCRHNSATQTSTQNPQTTSMQNFNDIFNDLFSCDW